MGIPSWLKKSIGNVEKIKEVWDLLSEYSLYTICQSAHCPNLGECFSRGVVTFLILGDTCTRRCRFCQVKKGRPLPVDEREPFKIKEVVLKLGLKFVVITSVTRDDLSDGGAEHFAKVVRELKKERIKVEVLVPDFKGKESSIIKVLSSSPDVFAHNLETVPRLYPEIRPQANYERSLKVLKIAKRISPSTPLKTGIMVGLGEKKEEVFEVMLQAKEAGCSLFTIGQYLAPSSSHYPVKEYLKPSAYKEFEDFGKKIGLLTFAGPWVRSSYLADLQWKRLKKLI